MKSVVVFSEGYKTEYFIEDKALSALTDYCIENSQGKIFRSKFRPAVAGDKEDISFLQKCMRYRKTITILIEANFFKSKTA